MFDLAINNGWVIDPKNRINSYLNIGILDGKIAKISRSKLSGKIEVDAANLIVSPGFIDIHIHEDNYNKDRDSFEFLISNTMVKMGVTTVIGGNCGIGTENPEAYLEAVERNKYPVNIGLFVPHECLRNSYGNFNKYLPVDEETIDNMAEKLGIYLDKGCLGLSFGLEYIPGIDNIEMLNLAKVCASKGKILAVHVRADGQEIIPSIIEIINLVEDTGVSIQISHIGSMGAFGHIDEVLSIVDEYRLQGMDISFDCYPYTACCTHIGSTTFDDGFLDKYGIDYSSLYINGEECTEEIFNCTRETKPETLLVAHIMNENDVDMAISHPACIVASDGIYVNGNGHPRGSGTFPRLINTYVKNKKILTLTEAIGKITALPAERFDLHGKGSLQLGYDADITIFNLEDIKDCASYENPFMSPKGIEYVIVNGEVALKKGDLVNTLLGKCVR